MRKNSKLKDYCAELQGEMENMWDQANQRINALSTRIKGPPSSSSQNVRECCS